MNILERFKKYIAFDTKSDENSTTYPSSPTQIEFGKMLVEELISLGVKDAYIDDYGLVYGHINNGSKNTIGLIAHMDTSPELDGGIKNPQLIKKYDGSTIKLNETYSMNTKEFPDLKTVIGEDLLVTDGEHLLGGDDKAGVAILMNFIEEYFKNIDKMNYNLAICFTPDEEVGNGAKHFSVAKMNADIAYTLDGGAINYANFENFNASSCKVEILGRGVHTGYAKDIMVNAALLGMEFNNLLPEDAIPSKTSGYEGFIHLDSIEGGVEKCVMHYILRDHNSLLLKEKEQLMLKARDTLLKKYPHAEINVNIRFTYRNMKDYFLKDPKAIELINRSYLTSGEKISYEPIRGGTDGATITYMGLPCPNLGIGSYNPHGRYEFVSLTQMERMVEILINMFQVNLDISKED